MDDGRELPLYKLEIDERIAPVLHRHPEERRFARRPGREVPQQVRPPRREEVSRATRLTKRQLRLPFSCRARARNNGARRLLHHSRSPDTRRVNSPNPALVSQREAAALPRMALLLLCAAYVLPGLFGRDPWKSADITAFGYMRQHRRRARRRGWRRRSAACPPTARCCRTGSARCSSACSARWSTRRWRRGSRSRCCSRSRWR